MELPYRLDGDKKGGDGMETVGDKLIALRGNRTRNEVASAIGVSQSAIAMYEQNERMPRDEVKRSIADYYKKTVGSIFFNE